METKFDIHILRNIAQLLKILKSRAKKERRFKDIITVEKIEKLFNGGFRGKDIE